MTTHLPIETDDPSAVVIRTTRPYQREPPRDWGGDALLGIWVAATAYIGCMCFLILVLAGIGTFASGVRLVDIVGELAMALLTAVCGTTIVLILVVTPLALICLGGSALLFISIQSHPNWTIVATFAGGLTGCVGTSLVLAVPPGTSLSGFALMLLLLLGPLVATVFGQIGGGVDECRPRLLSAGAAIGAGRQEPFPLRHPPGVGGDHLGGGGADIAQAGRPAECLCAIDPVRLAGDSSRDARPGAPRRSIDPQREAWGKGLTMLQQGVPRGTDCLHAASVVYCAELRRPLFVSCETMSGCGATSGFM